MAKQHESIGKGKQEQKEEIVASHAALDVVAGWLGIAPEEALGQEADEQEQGPAGRPQFLGLGAKFLPHKKAIGIAATLDTKLQRSLEAGRKRSAKRAHEEAEAAGLLGKHAPGSAAASAAQLGRQVSDDEDEEDAGKASQVRARQQAPAGGSAGAQLQGQQQTNGGGGGGGQHSKKRAANSFGQLSGPLPGSRAAREALLLGTGQHVSQHANGPGMHGKKKKKKREDS